MIAVKRYMDGQLQNNFSFHNRYVYQKDMKGSAIMSQWLQVAAVARIDDFRDSPVSAEDAAKMFEKVFGKECSWETGDFEDAFNHPENYLPMGSEGSLTMSVWVDPDISTLAAYTVSIFGSLRDRGSEDADEIIDWFKNKVSSVMTRNAIIDIGVEFDSHKVWVYNPDNLSIQFSHDSKYTA